MTAALVAPHPLQGLPLPDEDAAGAARAHVPGKRQAGGSAGYLQLFSAGSMVAESIPPLPSHHLKPPCPAPQQALLRAGYRPTVYRSIELQVGPGARSGLGRRRGLAAS